MQGYYNPASNRITMYDMSGSAADWQLNATVLIHEATHQMAFNTGIHNRYAADADLGGRGFGNAVRAPGVCDSRNHTQAADRVNRLRLRDFQQNVMPRHRPELLANIVACDDLFRSDMQTAYAEAWALTFYLVETQPRQYAQYLEANRGAALVSAVCGGRANRRLRGRLRRRLADARGQIPAIHGRGEVGRDGRLSLRESSATFAERKATIHAKS